MWPARLRLFISYRRGDSEASAGRVADALARQFGNRRVFHDTASMPLGQEFLRVLEQQLARADVVLVIIGPSWSSIANQRGIRLHQEDDPVRFEVSRALRSGKRVVPVLIDAAQMPRIEELPEDLRTLDKFTFEKIHNDSFASDFDALVDGVLGRRRGQLRTERDRLLAWMAGAGVSVFIVPALAMVASLGAWSGGFDYLQLDTRVQRALLPLAPRAGETDVMVAAIDAETERALGHEWGRDREAWRRGHADFIDAAAASGARAVLFDLAFDCGTADDACAPKPFEAIAAAARRAAQRVPPMSVVFGVRSRDGAQPALAAPLRGAGRVGHICLFDRGAGAMFSMPLAVLRGDPGKDALVPADTAAMAVAALSDQPLRTVDVERRSLEFDGPPRSPRLAFSALERRRDRDARCTLIAFGDLAATLEFAPSPEGYWREAQRRVSYAEIANWHAGSQARWRGRMLVVGVTEVMRAEANRDRFTVLDGAFGSRVVFGVELHADAVAALSSGRVATTPTVGAQMVTASFMALLGAALAIAGASWRWSTRFLALALPAATWVAVSVQQARQGSLLNPAYDVAALLLAYAALHVMQLAARRFLYGGPNDD